MIYVFGVIDAAGFAKDPWTVFIARDGGAPWCVSETKVPEIALHRLAEDERWDAIEALHIESWRLEGARHSDFGPWFDLLKRHPPKALTQLDFGFHQAEKASVGSLAALTAALPRLTRLGLNGTLTPLEPIARPLQELRIVGWGAPAIGWPAFFEGSPWAELRHLDVAVQGTMDGGAVLPALGPKLTGLRLACMTLSPAFIRGAGQASTSIRKLDLSGLDWVETEEEEEELVEAFRDSRAFWNALDRLELPFEAGEYIREELTEAGIVVHRFAS